jgi:hypothetical protein
LIRSFQGGYDIGLARIMQKLDAAFVGQVFEFRHG